MKCFLIGSPVSVASFWASAHNSLFWSEAVSNALRACAADKVRTSVADLLRLRLRNYGVPARSRRRYRRVVRRRGRFPDRSRIAISTAAWRSGCQRSSQSCRRGRRRNRSASSRRWPDGHPNAAQAWRDQRDWTEPKYAMWALGEKFQAQTAPMKYAANRPYVDADTRPRAGSSRSPMPSSQCRAASISMASWAGIARTAQARPPPR